MVFNLPFFDKSVAYNSAQRPVWHGVENFSRHYFLRRFNWHSPDTAHMNSKFLAILLSASITTVLLAADMTINSSPEGADVIVRATSEANGTTIGKTPLKVGISDLTSTYAKSPNFLMELVKE